MKLTVAETIIKCLEIEGVEYAFGISGSHYLAFFNALKNSKIKYISVKHESAAGFMALNYTKVSQKPALIMGTAGPGAMNLLNGISELYKCQIPCFVLSPLVSTNTFGKNPIQDDSGYGVTYSINNIIKNITKKSIVLFDESLTEHYMHELFRFSLNPPYGPVHISIPSNYFNKETECNFSEPKRYRLINDERIEIDKIEKVKRLFLEAEKPILIIGNRCNYPNCSEFLEKLSNEFKIPYLLTHASKGILNENSKLFGGVLDLFGHRSSEKFIKESDLVISFGMDFSEAETIKYDPQLLINAKLIAFDSDTRLIGINYPIVIGIAGDLNKTISYLYNSLKETNFISKYDIDEFNNAFNEFNKYQNQEMNEISTPLKMPAVLHELSKNIKIGKKSLVFVEQSATGFSSVRHYHSDKYEYYTSPTGYSMGQSVSGCIGGKLAKPNLPVFCITGDGSFLINGNEMLTAAQYKLGITWIIFKDDYLNMIEINQRIAYNGDLEFCTKIKNPEYESLAKAYHSEYFSVNTMEDLKESIKKAKKLNSESKTVIIIINYQYEEHLPLKARVIKTLEDMGQTHNLKSNPYLMRAFKKVLQEKV